METKEKKITVVNLGTGTHIFGAAHVPPLDKDGNPDNNKPLVCACSLQELGPKGTPKDRAEFTLAQFKFYDDEILKAKVESREYAVLVDGVDIRPDLARREAAKAAAAAASRTQSPATESAATVESSVLAEILSEGEQKTE